MSVGFKHDKGEQKKSYKKKGKKKKLWWMSAGLFLPQVPIENRKNVTKETKMDFYMSMDTYTAIYITIETVSWRDLPRSPIKLSGDEGVMIYGQQTASAVNLWPHEESKRKKRSLRKSGVPKINREWNFSRPKNRKESNTTSFIITISAFLKKRKTRTPFNNMSTLSKIENRAKGSHQIIKTKREI